MEGLSDERSEDEQTEEESEYAGDEAGRELDKDEGGEGVVALPHRVDEQVAEVGLVHGKNVQDTFN